VRGIDNVVGPGLQRVAPVERGLGSGLHGYDLGGGFCGVGASVADDVVGGDFCDGLRVC